MASPHNARQMSLALAPGTLVGVCAGLSALTLYSSQLRIPLLGAMTGAALLAVVWWVVCSSTRWVVAFVAATLLLPPLPLAWGNAGPHPAILIAGLGVLAGVIRQAAWEIRWHRVSIAVTMLWFALLASSPFSAVYSGIEAAGGTLARVGLFSISVYVFLYLKDGPGREMSADALVRLLFWTGLCSAVFACLDFYYQFPAPSRFAQQFVWLPGGVFRRAQGVFYEASTLGIFCVFLLVMIAGLTLRRVRTVVGLRLSGLLVGAVTLFAALVLSFSRAAIVSLFVCLGEMLWIERKRFGLARKVLRAGTVLLASLTGGVVAIYCLLPDLLVAYLQRLWFSGLYLLESPNLILSRRLESWQILADWLGEHPLSAILGVGYKTLPYSELVGRPIVADNMYLSLLIETGVPGLAALLLLHWTVLSACYRAATGPAGPGDKDLRRFLALWMFCFWCGLAVQMWSGDILTYWRILPVFFAVLAITVRDPARENPIP